MNRVLLLIVAAGAAASLTTFALVGPAEAHFQTGVYTHGGGCPDDPIDPINFVFGHWGTWDRAANSISVHASWFYGPNDVGSSQNFYSPEYATCSQEHAQQASNCRACTRFHIRLRGIHYDSSVGWTTVGDAHHEDWVWYCGHAVDQNGPKGSGFDQGRSELRYYLTFYPGHPWNSAYWGNTRNFKQCDEGYAGSDGWVDWVDIHQNYH